MAVASKAMKAVRGVAPRSVCRFQGTASQASPVESFHPRLVLENMDSTWEFSSRMRLPQRRTPSPKISSAGALQQPGSAATTFSTQQMPAVPVKFADPVLEGHFELPPSIHGKSLRKISQAAPRKLWSASKEIEDEVRAASLDAAVVLESLSGTDRNVSAWDDTSASNAVELVAAWVESLRTRGCGIIKNVKPEREAILGFIRAVFQAERATAYGTSFTIKSVRNPSNLAYNSEALLGHTDQPYMAEPPGIQLFHCIKQADKGGESRFLDGFAMARKVWEQDKEAFEILTKHQVLFHDLTPRWHLEAYHPIFELAQGVAPDADGMPALLRVHFNEQSRDSWRQYDANDPRQSRENLDKFYKALDIVDRMVWEEQELSFLLQPGEVIVSDNWRTFHNRSAFTGERHFEGAYIDWDIAEAVWRRSSRAMP